MFHFTYSPLPVTMLNGPKCNLTFHSFTRLAKKKVGKRAMFRGNSKNIWWISKWRREELPADGLSCPPRPPPHVSGQPFPLAAH